MGTLTIHWDNPTSTEVRLRNVEFPPQPANLVLDRIRFRGMEVLPRGIRLVHHWSRIASNITFVYEEPPTMRLIHFRKDEYYIPTPWVVYFLTLQGNRMWVDRLMYNTKPVESLDDILKIPVLPNVYIEPKSFCKVCPAAEAMALLEMRDGAIRYDLTIGTAIASFWASHFNDDILAYEAFLPMPYLGNSFTGMEALDESLICEVPWAPATSIKNLLSQMEWGTDIEKYQATETSATALQCLYREFHNAVGSDTYEDVIKGAPRPDLNSHPEECECDECYVHADDCECDECMGDD